MRSQLREPYTQIRTSSEKALEESRAALDSGRAAAQSWLEERKALESSVYSALSTFWRRHLGSGGAGGRESGEPSDASWRWQRRLLLTRLRWRRGSDLRLRALREKHKGNRRILRRIRRRLRFHRIRSVTFRASVVVARNRWKLLALALLALVWYLTRP